MLLPHELVARHVAPYLRALVAMELHGMGYGQERAARLLGVTQAMVNKYLSWGRRRVLKELEDAGVDGAEASSVARAAAVRLARGDHIGYLELLTAYSNRLLATGALCGLHRSSYGAPRGCTLCSRLFPPGGDEVLAAVEEAVRVFISTAPPSLVPNVGSNIVYARPEPRSVEDVAGLTGAIIRLSNGRLVAVGEPAYGGSRHTASVLLAAARKWPEIRAAIVVAYSRGCLERLAGEGAVLAAGPHCCPERLYDDIAAALGSAKERPVALASLGGINLEPVVYVFGSTPLEAVERALRCAAGASRA